MLKIYDVKSMFQVNRQNWKLCGNNGYTCCDESEVQEELVALDRCTFDEAFQIIPKLHLDGMYVGETLFNHRQYIEVHGYSTETQRRFYAKSVHTISYKYVFREREYVTLEWIMKHLSSEQAIHYFKERGISVCPINLQ